MIDRTTLESNMTKKYQVTDSRGKVHKRTTKSSTYTHAGAGPERRPTLDRRPVLRGRRNPRGTGGLKISPGIFTSRQRSFCASARSAGSRLPKKELDRLTCLDCGINVLEAGEYCVLTLGVWEVKLVR